MFRQLPLILAALLIFSQGYAQQVELNWKEHKKLAEDFLKSRQFADAAENFEKAWQLRAQEKDLIFKAGECYYQIKDFKKASQSFQHVKQENDQFPLVGLKYARSLKQTGEYETAKQEFVYFINAYQGEDKTQLNTIVSKEIKGCELAMSLLQERKTASTEIKLLNENVNSMQFEFSPIPFTDDLLYYSSTMQDNKATLFRTQRKNGEWNKSVVANGLPELPKKHIANGSFTPDSKRFYFTLCDETNELTSRCEIYVLTRQDSKWSAPVKLRDYINLEGTTTTQPCVVHQNGQEILYFSSNRSGGLGGMDIWYVSRQLNSNDFDFTYPVNAGQIINTEGDEITPYFNEIDNTLYFSSNSHISLGGWDIFKAKGALNKWSEVENMGMPINSSADEFYYILMPSKKGGFFSSNRLYGIEKISTQQEDIFEFGEIKKKDVFFIAGQVLDSQAKELLNVQLSLYDLTDGQEKLLSSKKISQSDYRFQLIPEKKFRLIAEKEGYQKSTFDFDSFDNVNFVDFTHVFKLPMQQATAQAVGFVPKEQPATIATTSTTAANEAKIKNKEKENNQNPTSSTTLTASTEKISPVTPEKTELTNSGFKYKVQLIAVNYHSADHSRYDKVKAMGKIETEQIEGKGVIRVLIADFNSKIEGEEIVKKAKELGFLDAFLVRYKDGQRVGRVW